MMLTLKYYWDERFRQLRAETNTPDNILGFFLEADVTGKYACDILLPKIEEVKAGKALSFDSVGNAFKLHIEAKQAILISVPKEDWIYEIDINDFQEIISQWCEAIIKLQERWVNYKHYLNHE